MKKKYYLNFWGILAVPFVIFGCYGCSSPEVQQGLTDILPVSEQIKQYYESQLPEPFEYDKGYLAFFDFSDGMQDAYTATQENLKILTNMVTATPDRWTVYSLVKNKVEKLELSPSEQFNLINYVDRTDIMAPIRAALDSIVNGNKRALLVTDFEEYQKDQNIGNVVMRDSYATPYFQKWLENGGVIKFYTTDYRENNTLNKKLYYVIFDSKDMPLIKDVDSRLKGNVSFEYVLSAEPYELHTEYTNGRGGNYYDSNGIDQIIEVNVQNGGYVCFADENSEFYQMGVSWTGIPGRVNNVKAIEGPNYLGIFSKLYIDLTDQDSYIINDFSLKVTDIRSDVACHAKNMAALRNTPDTIYDEQGNIIRWGFDTHKDAKFYYDTTTGALLPECEYHPQPTPVVRDLLFINNDIAQMSRSIDASRTHLVVDLAPQYSDAQLGYDENGNVTGLADYILSNQLAEYDHGTLRVDVCIGNTTSCDLDRLNKMFAFDSKKYGRNEIESNTCISGSIDEVLRNVKPDGKVIYTYFLYNE